MQVDWLCARATLTSHQRETYLLRVHDEQREDKVEWVDENVLSSFKGNIINYDDLYKNTEETLVNIIFHLKQSGLEIDINYDLISSYVKENPFPEEEFDQISNNDKKKLSSNLDQSLIEKFNFTIWLLITLTFH